MQEITKKEILERLRFDNSWWKEGKKGRIEAENKPHRQYFLPFHQKILDTSVRRALVLMGPRRVGKTVKE